VGKAGDTFLANLDAITVDQLCAEAVKANILEEERSGSDFAI